MKNVFGFLAFLLLTGCSAHKSFYDAGSVTTNEGVHEIKINMVNDLPLCTVQIDGRDYIFLVDTGAPSVISEDLFERLKLTESHSSLITDSQKKRRREKFARLPELRIGDVAFRDIGCAVLKFEGELKCFGIDGIIGANLMSKLIFRFDYANDRIQFSKNLTDFAVDQCDFTFDFKPKISRTPIVSGKIFERELSFTFDTGFSGNIKIPNDYDFYKSKALPDDFITCNGINGIGAYGHGKSATTFVMKNRMTIADLDFKDEIIDSGKATLIGNQFLKDYTFVIDWQNNKIYFKKNTAPKPKDFSGFGFAYLFINGKATVSNKLENQDIPLELGDEVIAIDSVIFADVNPAEHCRYFLNKVEKEKAEIDIRVKRKNEVLSFHLKKRAFIQMP